MAPADVTALGDQLVEALARPLGPVAVEGLVQLSGGASRETWSFDAVAPCGDRHRLVLRRDPLGRPSSPGAMGREARSLRAAAAAGLRVPEVVADDDGPSSWGSAGLVMRRVEGEALGRRILRDDAFAAARARLVGDVGRFLAGLHRIEPEAVGGLEPDDALAVFRDRLDGFGEARPTFELALRWLEVHRPPSGPPAVVHGDLRLGNVLVDGEGLAAVLDWELVHAGDPVEDLGWLCVKAWRFGAAPPVAGLGEREELVDAYVAAGGRPVPLDVLRWWEVLGTLRWGVGCMGQARVHLSGAVTSVELAAIGRRTCEQELDLLLLLAPDAVAAHLAAPVPPPHPPAADDLLGRPTASELLAAVRQHLADDVVPGTDGRLAFHARVAANVVAMVERELALGPSGPRRRAALAAFGVDDEAGLAGRIRAGELDDRWDEVVAVLVAGAADQLAVANPRYLAVAAGR